MAEPEVRNIEVLKEIVDAVDIINSLANREMITDEDRITALNLLNQRTEAKVLAYLNSLVEE